MRPVPLVVFVTALVAISPSARAQGQGITAEALFDQGRTLVKEGKIDEACTKFAESHRLDPAVGTLIYLADCHERAGRVATAWVTWRSAHAASVSTNQRDRAEMAKKRADALEPTLPRLTVTAKDTPGVSVKRGSEELRRASWGSPLPVDPGESVVTASADGYETFTKTVRLAKGESVTVEIPELVKSGGSMTTVAPTAGIASVTSAAPPTADAAKDHSGLSQKTVGMIVGGAGLVGLGVGGIFGLAAMSSASRRDELCPAGSTCRSQEAFDEDQSAHVAQRNGFVFAGVGIAVLVTGVVLVLTAPSKAASTQVGVSAQRSTFTLGGVF